MTFVCMCSFVWGGWVFCGGRCVKTHVYKPRFCPWLWQNQWTHTHTPQHPPELNIRAARVWVWHWSVVHVCRYSCVYPTHCFKMSPMLILLLREIEILFAQFRCWYCSYIVCWQFGEVQKTKINMENTIGDRASVGDMSDQIEEGGAVWDK